MHNGYIFGAVAVDLLSSILLNNSASFELLFLFLNCLTPKISRNRKSACQSIEIGFLSQQCFTINLKPISMSIEHSNGIALSSSRLISNTKCTFLYRLTLSSNSTNWHDGLACFFRNAAFRSQNRHHLNWLLRSLFHKHHESKQNFRRLIIVSQNPLLFPVMICCVHRFLNLLIFLSLSLCFWPRKPKVNMIFHFQSLCCTYMLFFCSFCVLYTRQ